MSYGYYPNAFWANAFGAPGIQRPGGSNRESCGTFFKLFRYLSTVFDRLAKDDKLSNGLFKSRRSSDGYNAASIEVLKGLEPVKRRPGMYTDTSRPTHLAQEIIDNSVDEAIAGYAKHNSRDSHEKSYP